MHSPLPRDNPPIDHRYSYIDTVARIFSPLSGIARGGLWKSPRYESRIEACWKTDGSDTGPYDFMRAAFLS